MHLADISQTTLKRDSPGWGVQQHGGSSQWSRKTLLQNTPCQRDMQLPDGTHVVVSQAIASLEPHGDAARKPQPQLV
jgi:hypothetical protein